MGRIPVVGGLLRALMSSYLAVTALLICFEVLANAFIIRRVPYTEIDWKAYMSEVAPPMDRGEYDYAQLRGGTGPLVYPGGFVWLYGLLYRVTRSGADIALAQGIFAALNTAVLAIVCRIYALARPSGFEPWMLSFLVLSKRVHSIFALRLFNDGPAMFLLYLAVLLILERRWRAGCVLYSLAVSVKMNIFLFAPALFLLMLAEGGLWFAFEHISICAAVQLLVGLPFLATDPISYLRQSFNLSRTFKQYWSVNFKFVPCTPLPAERQTLLNDCEGVFTSKAFGLGLLAATVLFWLAFAAFCAPRDGGGGVGGSYLSRALRGARMGPGAATLLLFVSNFIGVAFSRSLHFQFYVWYFHSLPLLASQTRLPVLVQAALLVAIELCWNPWKGETSTAESSLLLTACHAVLLGALFYTQWYSTKDKAGKND